ncbi:hypothetical protein BO86DRAFT_312695 [Aspergillus japonicus CBS 114.51]|uniref:Uncharacterized protein n=2 Tax=Aspergillus TaxID=5052 RepID=A0A2V5GRE8_ASPV1|nr:hypothetical protein BO86DRAFT_312695 [Aspergillus japonicus CBS 114.51]PYI13745.1 hypothetical protein BO99DRAFT_485646 [Aspergillus violaceofuscus CBS 115571]RAH81929.1 hypothetical protein BO86DRAFT_312695 [Aspergillus japonicus CBS 114.51]
MTRFKCRISGCNSSFQRKEHRTRHEGQHTGALTRACPFCARSFSRGDSLRRHIRLDHHDSQATSTTTSTRTAKACLGCRQAKTRCGGGNPCNRCRAQPQPCLYDQPQKPPQPPQPAVQSLSPQSPPSEDDSTSRFTPYVHLYFTHFHPHWPILHRATFSPPDEPLLLLQVVSMIGLWVSDTPSSREAAISLHRKLGSSILAQQDNWARSISFTTELSDSDTNLSAQEIVSRCPVATYQAILLYLIFSLVLTRTGHGTSDSRTNLSRAVDLNLPFSPQDTHILSVLVTTCLRNHVFYYPLMLERYHQTIDSVACIWVGVEELKRLGLAMYKVCRLSGHGARIVEGHALAMGHDEQEQRGVLRLADLQFPPPDSRHLWEAQSNPELARLLQIEARTRGGAASRLDGREEGNWISACGRVLEDGRDTWWL